MEELLEQLCPGADLLRDFRAALGESTMVSEDENEQNNHDGEGPSRIRPPSVDGSFDYAIPPSLLTHTSLSPATTYLPQTSDAPEGDVEEPDTSDDELLMRRSLTAPLRQPHSDNANTDRRFFGKSSSFTIVKAAADIKKHYHPESSYIGILREPAITFRSTPDMPAVSYLSCGCPDYGSFHPWAAPLAPYSSTYTQPFTFPPDDLLSSLISLYFTMHNNYTPILHRPTFERTLMDKKHFVDEDFGGIVLLVCAIGARWSKDRSVLLDEEARADDEDEGEDEEEWHSAGWKWFKQVQIGRKALFSPPALCDIQIHCLASIYLRGSSTPEATRTQIGVGLRLAQDIGAHRNKICKSLPPDEGEMLKRVFWVLVWVDWVLSPQLGRPCGVQHEDFDVDLPVECDDEYWVQDGSTLQFLQPDDKPPITSFFNCFLRLNQIQAFAMRTIYSTTKSRTILGFIGPQWEERIVAELDSALNKWIDSIPTYLRWDPRCTDTTWISQSAILYAAYCALQIMIHRPFISYTRAHVSSEASRLPSLTICVNAARSCVHVLDLAWKKLGHSSEQAAVVLHYCIVPLFNCGIVLMLNMLGKAEANKINRDELAEMKEMADVHTTMDMLKLIETRWHSAGRLWDMLYELAVVGDLPLPSYSHASVIRSSNRRMFKAQQAKPPPAPGPQVPPVKNLHITTLHTSTPSSEKKSPPASTDKSSSAVSAERNALHQVLYPKHAHLFTPHSDNTSSEWDLSPSMFTQSAGESDKARRAGISGLEPYTKLDEQSVFAGSQPKAGPSTLTQTTVDADWASWTTAAELAVRMRPEATWPTTNHGANPPPVSPAFLESPYTQSKTAMFQPRDGSEASTNEQMRSFSIGSGRHQDLNEFYGQGRTRDPSPNSATAPADMFLDNAERRATLAMWQSVPESFDWDTWGAYITSFGNENVSIPDLAPTDDLMSGAYSFNERM